MWQAVQAQRVPSPYVDAPERPRLDESRLAELFNNATSPEACALAARSFAENPGSLTRSLTRFLNDLPAAVSLVALCRHLADELASADVRDPLIWHEMLDSIRKESHYERATPQETLELLQGCARSLGSLKVDSVDLWSTILESAQERLPRGADFQAIAGIARDMMHAGIEQEVLWNSLIELFADPRLPAYPYAGVATALKNAGVDSALLWRLLHDTMNEDKDRLPPPSVRKAFYQILFSAEPAPLDIAALIRQFGASSLISSCKTKDLAIWKRVIDAALQTGALPAAAEVFAARSPPQGVWEYLLSAIDSAPNAVGCDIGVRVRVARGLALSAARDPVDWQRVIDGAVEEGASRLPDEDASGLISLLDRPINYETNTMISTLRSILTVALRASEDVRQLICSHIRIHVESKTFVAAWASLRSAVLLEPLVRLVLGKDFERGADFVRTLGTKNAFFVVMNLHEEVPVEQRAAYRSMLEDVLTNRTLGLDSIEAVRAHRDLLRKSAPSIEWEAIFHPRATGFPTRKFYSSFPELQTNVDGFLKSLKVLVLEIGAYTNELHKKGVARNAPERVALREEVMARLIGTVTDPNARVAAVQLWGQSGEKDIQVDQALLSRLIRYGAINPDAARELEQAVSVLALQTSPEVLGPKVAEMLKCWDRLKNCVNAPGFVELYNVCGDYEVAMLDPDDVANLKVGYEVSSCLAPDGTHSGELFSRLAGGWILWAVKNPQGETAAIAWGALNKECELVIDFIDERVKFRVPPLGNNLVEQLIGFAPVVAKTVNAQAAWLAPARYGRLERFPAFADRTTELRSFKTLVPDFLGVGTYTDALDVGKVPYVRLL